MCASHALSITCVHDPNEKQDGVLGDLTEDQGISDLLEGQWLYLTASNIPRSSQLDSNQRLVSDMIAIDF